MGQGKFQTTVTSSVMKSELCKNERIPSKNTPISHHNTHTIPLLASALNFLATLSRLRTAPPPPATCANAPHHQPHPQ